MRFLVVVCLSIILVSVAVFSSLAHAQALCSPTNPVIINAITPPIASGSVLINEIMPTPTSTTSPNCTIQAISGWLEIFNPQNQAYNLGSIYAAIDNGAGTTAYYLDINSAIAAHGYFVLFPPTRLHLSGPIRLLFEGVPVDQVTVPDLNTGQSYARLPDGAANWHITTTPTMDTNNTLPSNTPTITPTLPAHKTSITTKTTHPQNGSYTTRSTTTMIPQTSTSAQKAIAQQPTWNALHLPQEATNLQTPPTTAPSPTASMASDSLGAPSLFPLLLAGGILTGLTGTLLIWYRRRRHKIT